MIVCKSSIQWQQLKLRVVFWSVITANTCAIRAQGLLQASAVEREVAAALAMAKTLEPLPQYSRTRQHERTRNPKP